MKWCIYIYSQQYEFKTISTINNVAIYKSNSSCTGNSSCAVGCGCALPTTSATININSHVYVIALSPRVSGNTHIPGTRYLVRAGSGIPSGIFWPSESTTQFAHIPCPDAEGCMEGVHFFSSPPAICGLLGFFSDCWAFWDPRHLRSETKKNLLSFS